MKSYKRPVVLVHEELAEGVYAASGDSLTDVEVSFDGYNCHIKFRNDKDKWGKEFHVDYECGGNKYQHRGYYEQHKGISFACGGQKPQNVRIRQCGW